MPGRGALLATSGSLQGASPARDDLIPCSVVACELVWREKIRPVPAGGAPKIPWTCHRRAPCRGSLRRPGSTTGAPSRSPATWSNGSPSDGRVGSAARTGRAAQGRPKAHRPASRRRTPRDLYDIAIARRLDPKALDTALATIPAPALDDIRTNLALLGRDWVRDHSKPLLRPIHSRDAADSVAIVHRVIGRHLDGRDPPTPRNPSISPAPRGR